MAADPRPGPPAPRSPGAGVASPNRVPNARSGPAEWGENMDAKAITHLCESPLKAARSESRPANRQSAYLIVIRGGLPGTMLRINSDEATLGRSSENTFPLD